MALANLAREVRQVEGSSYFETLSEPHRSAEPIKMRGYYGGGELELISRFHVGYKSRRMTLVRSHTDVTVTEKWVGLESRTNRPTISKWVYMTVDAVGLISAAIVVVSFFISALELAGGRAVYLAPSFFTFLLFFVVASAAVKFRKRLLCFKKGAIEI